MGAIFKWSNYPTSAQLEAKYYAIACGLQLNDETAAPLAKTFIETEHNAPRVQMMSFQLLNTIIVKRILQTPLLLREGRH